MALQEARSRGRSTSEPGSPNARTFSGQSAEVIAKRGGFGISELVTQLGHMPMTWKPSGNTKFLRSVVAGPSLEEVGVRQAWEDAHEEFCPRGEACSTHLRPGDRYHLAPPTSNEDPS